MLYLAADHRGFQLKESLKDYLISRGLSLEDVGAFVLDPADDYVDFAVRAAEMISQNPAEHKGIFLCGSGHGMDIVANKFQGMRPALCWNKEVAKQSREHEDANVLVLPADWLDEKVAKEIVDMWLKMEFSNEKRHVRRLEKIKTIETIANE